MELVSSYANVRFFHQLSKLNNLGALLMNHGDLDNAALACRDGLKMMKLVNNGFEIEQCLNKLDEMIQILESKVDALDMTRINVGLTYMVDLTLIDFQPPNLVDLLEVTKPTIYSLRIDTCNFDIGDLPTADLLCSVLMYNMATTHLLAAQRMSDMDFIRRKFQASRSIFVLALHVVDMQEYSPGKDIIQCEICMTISGLINACLSIIAEQLGEIHAANSFREISQKRASDLLRISEWMCTIFGQDFIRRTAPAA